MKDALSIARIQKAHPILRTELNYIYDELYEKGVYIRITDTLRTFEQQNALYKLGRTKPGQIVTDAKGGESFHNYGLAIDFCLLIDGKKVSWDRNKDLNNDGKKDWLQVVEVFKKYDWRWGGDFQLKNKTRDYPHFDKSFGLTTDELYKLYKAGHLENGYVKL